VRRSVRMESSPLCDRALFRGEFAIGVQVGAGRRC
jgi:hypothetical protein